MPPLNIHPIPKKRFHGGRWRIYWKWNRQQFSVATDYTDPKKSSVVDVDLRLFSAALAMERPIFPDAYQDSPAVKAYMAVRFPDTAIMHFDAGSWLDDYGNEIKGECAAKWASMSVTYLRALDAATSGLAGLTPDEASKYLATTLTTHSVGTRNRLLAIFSRFFKWAIRTGRTQSNPFTGVRTLKEERSSDIVYCTPAERDEAIAFAQSTGWEEWLAVPMAFYSGMRREEIANLTWPDIRFEAGLVVVAKTKTRKSRTIPMNATLEEYFRAVPDAKRVGYVIKCAPGIDRLLRMDNLTRKVQKLKREALMGKWDIKRPKPSRSKDYADQKKAYEAEKIKRKTEVDDALERIGWNAWRHTFGSLLAQAGVSLDKISAWMGNTPEVCRRHYAQFIPRDRRDGEIDKL